MITIKKALKIALITTMLSYTGCQTKNYLENTIETKKRDIERTTYQNPIFQKEYKLNETIEDLKKIKKLASKNDFETIDSIINTEIDTYERTLQQHKRKHYNEYEELTQKQADIEEKEKELKPYNNIAKQTRNIFGFVAGYYALLAMSLLGKKMKEE